MLVAAIALTANAGPCDKYIQNPWNICNASCGHCFNGGARSNGTKICTAGTATGYLCPPDAQGQGGDIAFACMDWTFGSSSMRRAEAAFKASSGEDVFFGVGTFGTSDDPQQGLGACYRLTAKGVSKDIIAQSLNTGSDVAGNQFDMQIGAGGAGIFNTCVGGDESMYDGGLPPWGCQYGGVDNKSACAGLPEYPRDAAAMKAAGDSLVTLCEYSWDQSVRLSGAGKPAGVCKYNPTLLDVSRVRCPDELAELTWFQRSDEPAGYATSAAHRVPGFPNADHECHTDAQPVGSSAYCLTRMMDCRKPSGAWRSNVKPELMVAGRRVVQTCAADGYTRYDVQCGCFDCNC